MTTYQVEIQFSLPADIDIQRVADWFNRVIKHESGMDAAITKVQKVDSTTAGAKKQETR